MKIFITVLAIFFSIQAKSDDVSACDDRYVKSEGSSLVVRSTNDASFTDDININCAIELAKKRQVRLIRLPDAEYWLEESIYVDEWTGEIQGSTMRGTKIQGIHAVVGFPAKFAFSVAKSNLKISRLSIYGSGGIGMYSTLWREAPQKNTSHLNVDRVAFRNVRVGILISGYSDPQGDESYDPYLQGSVTVNRSLFYNIAEYAFYQQLTTGGFRTNITFNDIDGVRHTYNGDAYGGLFFTRNYGSDINITGNSFYDSLDSFINVKTENATLNITHNKFLYDDGGLFIGNKGATYLARNSFSSGSRSYLLRSAATSTYAVIGNKFNGSVLELGGDDSQFALLKNHNVILRRR